MTATSGQVFAAISVEEIAFAMSMFVGAASLRIPRSHTSTQSRAVCDAQRTLIHATSELRDGVPREVQGNRSESTLDHAFDVLWQHYEGDSRRASICARVLAFHDLMNRSRGYFLQGWLIPCVENPETVLLDPAIVQAVATVPLSSGGLLSELLFLSTLESLLTVAAHA